MSPGNHEKQVTEGLVRGELPETEPSTQIMA